jgi:SAM-dependent methyltransferase
VDPRVPWARPAATLIEDNDERTYEPCMYSAAEEHAMVAAVPSNYRACSACGCNDSRPFLRSRDFFFMRQPMYQLVRCDCCHLSWLQNPPPPEDMASHYGADYDRVITAPGDLYPHHWDLVRNKLLHYVQSGSILDIGCSSGSFLRTLKGEAWKLYGIEMSKVVADQARATTGAEVFVGDVLDAPFPENKFDAVTGFHVLEHMYDPRKVMAKVLSWLKPGGICILTLPNIDSLEARLFRRYWFGLDVPRHLWQFSPRPLRAMASSVGFQPVEVATGSCYIESSIGNLIADLKLRSGISPVPPNGDEPALPFRIMRKAFRLGFVAAFRELAVAAGAGADLRAVFRKPH